MDSTKSNEFNPNDTLVKTLQDFNQNRNNPSFQALVVKKRGVYVERKPTKLSLDTANAATQKEVIKVPPRPVRGKKQFLSSVLNLLSKSSTGTQWPDTVADKTKTKRKKTVKKTDLNSDKLIQHQAEAETVGRKMKFKSRILNDPNNRFDKFEVLQPMKNIVHTPSVTNSECVAEFLPQHVQSDVDDIDVEKEKKLSHLVREVTEGRLVNEKKEKVDDPPTLVSEQNDKGLYNFFVDLLETTFSVCNIKDDYNQRQKVAKSAASSKISLVIDESVARKLNVTKNEIDESPTRSNRYQYFQDDTVDRIEGKQVDCIRPSKSRRLRQETPLRSPQKRRMKSQSFYTMKLDNIETYPKVNSPKSVPKKTTKQNFLNLLKEQLSIDTNPFEEPQNLYEALKVMAKNKTKSRKFIRFDKSTKNEYNRKGVFKRTKLAAPDSRAVMKQIVSSQYPHQRAAEFGGRKNAIDTDDDVSSHSLEVYNMDYDNYGTKIEKKKLKKDNVPYYKYKPRNEPEMNRLMMTLEAICRNKKPIMTTF